MAFSPEAMKASIRRGGLSHQSHFDCIITPPVKLQTDSLSRSLRSAGIFSGDAATVRTTTGASTNLSAFQDLTLRISAADLPGRGTKPTYVKYWGPERNFAMTPSYVDATIIIICSENLVERELFMRWQDLMFGSHRSSTSATTTTRYTTGYYDDYIGKVTVRQYSPKGNVVYTIELMEAYPVIINPLSSSWDSNDVHKLSVSFNYHHFEESSSE